MNKLLTTIFIVLISLVQCSGTKETISTVKNLPKFEEITDDTFIIRYSNVIESYQGKTYKIPIYGGIYEDITYEDLKKLQTNKTIYSLGHVFVKVKKNEVTKTFYDFLNFYKKSFFRDIDVNFPSMIANEGYDTHFIWYDFIYEGIPSSMMITIEVDEKETRKRLKKKYMSLNEDEEIVKTLDLYAFDENSTDFIYSIVIGEESGYKRK